MNRQKLTAAAAAAAAAVCYTIVGSRGQDSHVREAQHRECKLEPFEPSRCRLSKKGFRAAEHDVKAETAS